MGLSDWLSGLFSSKSGEESNDSENNKESNDDKDTEAIQTTYEATENQGQVDSDLITQDKHETESNSAEADHHAKDEA